ncbi:MAG: hypothetical protein QF473_41035 [Planctomycetota bacterium]|nr:hypothetical protein [Planctomycetota bacterium]
MNADVAVTTVSDSSIPKTKAVPEITFQSLSVLNRRFNNNGTTEYPASSIEHHSQQRQSRVPVFLIPNSFLSHSQAFLSPSLEGMQIALHSSFKNARRLQTGLMAKPRFKRDLLTAALSGASGGPFTPKFWFNNCTQF